MRKLRFAVLGGAIALAIAACGSDSVPLSGSIHVDGSTTVAPLTKAMARRFMAEHPGVRITVGTAGAAGTDRGFARLCRGETDANDAADRIDGASRAACRRAGVAWAEIPVVNDAVILMVNPTVPVKCLTTDQLAQIWHGNSEVTTSWSQVHDLDPPFDGSLTAWGPGIDTETFAFFTRAVNHDEGETRDYNNSLHREAAPVEAIAGSPELLGYADYRFYAARRGSVRAIEIDSGAGCVAPTPATIAGGTFRPLSRRLFVYPSAAAAARPAMQAFLRFYLDNVGTVAPQAGYVPLTDGQLAASRARLEQLIARSRRQLS